MLWLRAYANTEDRVSAHGAKRCPAYSVTPIRPRSIVELVHGERQLDVLDDAVVVVDNSGVRIPIIDVDCLVLKPGARISHAASPWRRARERWSQGSAKRVSALRAAGRT